MGRGDAGCRRCGERHGRAACLTRQALERAVEEMLASVQEMIGALDQVDGDADAEPQAEEDGGDAEPSLGWPDPGVQLMAAGGEDLED